MNGQELVDLAIAKVVPITDAGMAANINSAFALQAVNEGYRTVERAALWRYSEASGTLTTVAGQQDYDENTDIASDLVNILHIYDDTSNHLLDFYDERQQVWDYGTATGIPEAYSNWGGTLRLFPTPSVVRNLTVRYYFSWTALTTGTSPVFPAMYHDMLADYAAAQMSLRMPVSDAQLQQVNSYRVLPAYRAQPYQQDFATKLQQMMNDPRSGVSVDEIRNHDWERYVTYSQDW